MRILLILLIVVQIYTDLMGGALLGPISAKNTLLYLTVMALMLQFVVRRDFRFQLPALDFSLILLMVYALTSMVITAKVVHFPRYEILPSFVLLKSTLIDWNLFFFVFFYGTRGTKDSEELTKILLLAVSAANLITLTNIAGITNIGIDPFGYDDPSNPRVRGIFGHENETGAMLGAFLPVYIAIVESKRGIARLFWIGAMMTSVAVLFMTSSRGAIFALLVGGAWGAYVCRRYLSMDRAIKWVTISFVVALPIMAILGFRYWDLLMLRLQGSSSSSMDELSSGRTELWIEGLTTMIDQPSSLLVGYGWDTWTLFPFRFITHNTYLWLWFELGLAGLGCLIVAFRTTVVTALKAVKAAEAESHRMLVGYVIGILILAVAIFFANLWNPWPYLWIFIALSTRSALSILSVKQASSAVGRRVPKFTPVPPPILQGARTGGRMARRTGAEKHA